MKTPAILAVIFALLASPTFASHANPWATEEDAVLSRYHDANQSKSVGTPGTDEMRGAMVRRARGKLENPGRTGIGKGRGN